MKIQYIQNSVKRLYKTGDLVKWQHKQLHYLGRLDEQVKVRGFCVELDEIKQHVLKHPAVKQAAIVPIKNHYSYQSLSAYIVLNNDNNEKTILKKTLDHESVRDWKTLYEHLYGQTDIKTQSLFNTSGWTSALTGKIIPEIEMREWVKETVNRILLLKPQRILEIGSGVGLLLFKLIPHCKHYIATDFSSSAIDYISKQNFYQQYQHKITLQTCTAAQVPLDQLPAYDTIIINSVAQYFPSVDYLTDVLNSIINHTTSPIKIFIGDIKNFELLNAFHHLVALYQAQPNTTYAQWKATIQRQISLEEELFISPKFFMTFKKLHKKFIMWMCN